MYMFKYVMKRIGLMLLTFSVIMTIILIKEAIFYAEYSSGL